MQLALIILAGFGALLFVISFLRYVLSGFRHHFVTGIIAALPVLNIVTLPSLWHNSRGKFLTGAFGLMIAAVAWFFGANTGIKTMLANRQGATTPAVTTGNTAIPNPATNNTNAPMPTATFAESNIVSLPTKALYKMTFDDVPVNQINTLTGRIVQITNTDDEQLEGRLKEVSAGIVVLEGTVNNEISLASIKKLKLMVKKAIQ